MRFLFQPCRLRAVELKNRIICGPMEKNLCTEQGLATNRYADYVEERARGGAALILLESAYVDQIGKARRFQMGLHNDAVIRPLRRMVDRAHRFGAAVGVQLHHGGRTSQEAITGVQPVAPSPVPCRVLAGGDVPRAMTVADIRRVIEKFQAAARRALDAGMDVVEIHGAHGYLVGQFLSSYSNRRTDEYGGSFTNRCRFPVEVIRAVREAVGPDYPILYRISGDEFIDQGLGLEETVRFAGVLEEEGVDLIDISAGIYESGYMVVQPMEFPLGGYVYMARAFKQAVNLPISVAGRISEVHLAESILAEGSADLVTMTRAFHADPHFPEKVKQGRLNEVCLCIGCNQGCTDRLRENVPLSCLLNPRSGYEREFRLRPTRERKTVWVAGGGPAGLMAARICALRGHRVVLFERKKELGGQVRYVSRIEHKADFGQGLRYLINEVHRAGVKVRTGVELDADEIQRGGPEVLIVATGSRPGEAPVSGEGRFSVHNYLEALDAPGSLGRRVIVLGGGMIGGEIALYLAERDRRVTLVVPDEVLIPDLGPRASWYLTDKLNAHPRIEILLNARLDSATAAGLLLQDPQHPLTLNDFDSVVTALQRVPERRLLAMAEEKGAVGRVFAVGDCRTPARITEATFEATRVAVAV